MVCLNCVVLCPVVGRERLCEWSTAVRELLSLRAERLGIDCERRLEGGGWGWGENELRETEREREMDKVVQLLCFKRLRSSNSSEGLVQTAV